jgi:diguanylate cyclase (GGDEF)-like protein/PAS domain S-box-containing protein
MRDHLVKTLGVQMNDFLNSDAVWRRFLGNLRDYAIVILDANGNVVAWNEGARALQGYSAEEIIGTHFSAFYTPEARAVGHPERELALAGSVGRYEEEGWRVRKDKTRFWAHVVISAIFDDDNTLRGYGKVLRDFTAQKQAMEQSANVMNLLEHTARTDYLTGLDNRRALDKSLAMAIREAEAQDRPLCLAMIDLDKFKTYNDERGHLAGDVYLRRATSAWRDTMRPRDVIARYGGEEFVMVLPDTDPKRAVLCLDRLRGATPPPLTCSVGVAEWDGTETADSLISRADHALYEAKRAGRDRLMVAPLPAPAPHPRGLTVIETEPGVKAGGPAAALRGGR